MSIFFSFLGQLRGLLGNYDADPFNDLQNANGVLINASESTQTIHTQFGLTCKKNTSLTLLLFYFYHHICHPLFPNSV